MERKTFISLSKLYLLIAAILTAALAALKAVELIDIHWFYVYTLFWAPIMLACALIGFVVFCYCGASIVIELYSANIQRKHNKARKNK